MLKDEFQYYIDNQKNLVEKYNGRFIVIMDQQVKGAYSSQSEAYEEARKKFVLGTFLIQHCISGTDSYTTTFHSRVILNFIPT